MGKKLLYLAIAFALLSNGCIVISESDEQWLEKETFKGQVSGPGADDISFNHWERNLYDVYSGKKLAIGFFPGSGESFEKHGVGGAGASAFTSCLANALTFGMPTVTSLLIAPLDESERKRAAEYGLLGCYQWDESGSEELIEKGEEEDIVRFVAPEDDLTLSREDVRGDTDCGRTANGVKLYFGYPGARKIIEDVKADGKAAVMHDYPSNQYRLFTKADYAQDAYHVVDMVVLGGEDSMVNRQSAFVHNCRRVRDRAHDFVEYEEFRDCELAIKNGINGLLLKLPETDPAALAGYENKFVEGLAEVSRKRIAAGDWESALAICDAIDFDGEDKVRNDAQAECERQRIAKKLEDIDAQMASGNWDEAIKLAESEENEEITAKLAQIKAQIAESILREIESSSDCQWLDCISTGHDSGTMVERADAIARNEQAERDRERAKQERQARRDQAKKAKKSNNDFPEITIDAAGWFTVSGTRNSAEFSKAVEIASRIHEQDRDRWNATARRMVLEAFGNGQVYEEKEPEEEIAVVEVSAESDPDKMIRYSKILASAEIKTAADTRSLMLKIPLSSDLLWLDGLAKNDEREEVRAAAEKQYVDVMKRRIDASANLNWLDGLAKNDEREEVRAAAEKQYVDVMKRWIDASANLNWLDGLAKNDEREVVRAMAENRILAVWKDKIHKSDDLDWLDDVSKADEREAVRTLAQSKIAQIRERTVQAVDGYYRNQTEERYRQTLKTSRGNRYSVDTYPWRNVSAPRRKLTEDENNLGRGKIDEFASQYLPGMYAEYESAYEQVEELQQKFDKVFPDPCAVKERDATWNAYTNLLGRLIAARTRYFRDHDEICHYYLLHKVGALSAAGLADVDSDRPPVALFEENLGSVDFAISGEKARRLVPLGNEERAFAEKYAPELYAIYQKCENERTEAQKLFGELLSDVKAMDIDRPEIPVVACREKIDMITLALNGMTDSFKAWRVEHETGLKDAGTVARLDHEQALKRKEFADSLPGYIKERSLKPALPGNDLQWWPLRYLQELNAGYDFGAGSLWLKEIERSAWFQR